MSNNLNLARKWRPQTFEQIIGQELSVSMLKNSLYLKKLFPVYLFSGQRGCGKTSSARVFGCAINCKKLPTFQGDARNYSVPCLNCDSCTAMLNGNHPDFIEIDAASHTGVDNVRQIIESCAYMPLSGFKKIYLIDEAHMLSKAAFNAFLKILEEPPMSAIFILATTEFQKLPDTVRSRCFHVHFHAVDSILLKNHLKTICSQENISVEDNALELLIQETDGSVRDTLNALEQVRFTSDIITKELVLQSLGKISEESLFTLFAEIFAQNPKNVLTHLMAINFESITPQNLWSMSLHLLRTMLWLKNGVQNKSLLGYSAHEKLVVLAQQCSINKLHALLQIMWTQEPTFLQTPHKHLFLEQTFLHMCKQVNVDDLKDLINTCKNIPTTVITSPQAQVLASANTETGATTAATPNTNFQPITKDPTPPAPSSSEILGWGKFLAELEQECNDAMLLSIFKQATLTANDATMTNFTLQVANNGPFLIDKITDCEAIWRPILLQMISTFHAWTIVGRPNNPVVAVKKPSIQTQAMPQPHAHSSAPIPPYSKPPSPKQSEGTPFTISEPEKWPKATLLSKAFSGKLEKVTDNK